MGFLARTWQPVHRALLAMPLGLVCALPLVRREVDPPVYVPRGAPASWPTPDGVGGTHWSPLGDITVDNVRHLEVAWQYRTGDVASHGDGLAGTAFEATPVMVGGVLYVVTPFGRAIALDADTGEEIWTFDPGLDRSDKHHAMLASRGLAVWRDPARGAHEECAVRVLSPVYNARLFALDGRTGKPCSDFAGAGGLDLATAVVGIEGRRGHLKQTAPPTVVGELVVVGSTLLDSKHARAPSGAVRAFDVRTGALRWVWEPLVGVDHATPGGEAIDAGAANTWATITADEERDLLFVPTSSPSPDHYGGLRPGDNRYANSLVALRASTGEVVWHFQMVHHDLWDYDLPSPPALIELRRDGVMVPAVVQTTKMGWVFVFDRETGEPLFDVVEQPVPPSDVPGERVSPTQPVPVLPPALTPHGLRPEDAWGVTPFDRAACRSRIEGLRSDGVYAPPSVRGTIAYPGFVGGMEWGGVAYDPASGLLVTNTNRIAMVATLVPREVADTLTDAGEGAKFSLGRQKGAPYGVRREPLLSPLGIPCSPPPWGMLHAIDMSTGEVAWEAPLGTMTDITKVPTPRAWGSPNLGGPLVTGGLVFIAATLDRRIRAFELATGDEVWTAKLPASALASPLTYRARADGRQLVVVAAGGHDGIGSSLGDWLIAYGLPQAEEVVR